MYENWIFDKKNIKIGNGNKNSYTKINTCSSNTSFMCNFVSPEPVFIVTGKTVDYDGYW